MSLLKKRYRLGFAFGKFEHRTRERAYILLVLGLGILAIGIWILEYSWIIVIGASVIGLALLLETVSYISHRLEKKVMDGIRFGKRR